MFEKEAEEIANKRCHEIMCFGHCSFSSPKHHRCGEWHREYNCAKEGIEFGYNKGRNEAKEIIREFVEWATWQGSNCPSFKSIQDKAEQFLKDCEVE